MPANYTHVNAAWPENAPVPTPQEALSGAKRLYRLANGKAFRGKWKLTSGRRHTYPRSGIFYVNPNREGWGFSGWKEIVHGISHAAARRLYPGAKPHDSRHAFIERSLVEHVVKSGWLAGELKRPEKAKPDLREIRRKRILTRIESWDARRRKAESVVKRAERALKKLQRSRVRYELED